MRAMQTLLYGVAAGDPVTFLSVLGLAFRARGLTLFERRAHDWLACPVLTASAARSADIGVPTSPDQRSHCLTAIDMLRGLVIVIMPVDHVRDFFLAGAQQDPMTDPNVTVRTMTIGTINGVFGARG
jgi:hypothetical protein